MHGKCMYAGPLLPIRIWIARVWMHNHVSLLICAKPVTITYALTQTVGFPYSGHKVIVTKRNTVKADEL